MTLTMPGGIGVRLRPVLGSISAARGLVRIEKGTQPRLLGAMRAIYRPDRAQNGVTAAHAQGCVVMGIVSWIVLGLLAGWLGGLVTGRRGQGCLTTTAIGLIGALLGGALANAAGYDGRITDLNLRSVLISALGAALLLFVFGSIDRR